MRGVTECQTKSPEPAETDRIQIVVNGDETTVPAGLNVRTLLDWLKIDATRVAIELDREIVRQAQWTKTGVGAGAKLEIVQFVGGG